MMIEMIGSAAMLEQLAEEATELAHAALKAARVVRGENPTPVTLAEAAVNLREEYTDVVQCAKGVDLKIDYRQIQEKTVRFKSRMRAGEHVEEECIWVLVNEESAVYKTSCESHWYLKKGTPGENNINYCPVCGKKIKVVKAKNRIKGKVSKW